MTTEMTNSTVEVLSSGADDIKSRYAAMIVDVRSKPLNIHNYAKLFNEIFETHDAKLVVEDGDLHFAHGDICLTNFGAIISEVRHIHNLDRVLFFVELIVQCNFEKPKVVSVNSLELGSNRWIESLGVSYIYDKTDIIWRAIKIMSKYAPSMNIYNYSGWSVDKRDTYIMEGKELCAKK